MYVDEYLLVGLLGQGCIDMAHTVIRAYFIKLQTATKPSGDDELAIEIGTVLGVVLAHAGLSAENYCDYACSSPQQQHTGCKYALSS